MITGEEFKQDVLTRAEEIGVVPKEIHIRKMKRKWASCSSRGRLTFDISILNEPEGVRLRIILHELLHLKYPNHGRMFNTLLNAYLKRSQMNIGIDKDADMKARQTPNYKEDYAWEQIE